MISPAIALASGPAIDVAAGCSNWLARAVVGTGVDDAPNDEDLPAIAELAERKQWVNWRPVRRDGKVTKVPFAPPTRLEFGLGARRQRPASTTNRSTWGDREFARFATFTGTGTGVGFVFAEDDPYIGIDLDDCFDASGDLKQWASKVLGSVSTYTEVSPSGKGLYLIGRGRLSGSGLKIAREAGAIEIYDRGRYFTVSGDHFTGTPVEIFDVQAAIDGLCASVVQQRRSSQVPAVIERVITYVSDNEIISKCRGASSRFGALFDRGETAAYGNDDSKADWALVCMLAEATSDFEQIERLFGHSPLSRREKWQSRPDYRQRTIERAIANTDRPAAPATESDDSTSDRVTRPSRRSGDWLLAAVDDIELFHDAQRVAYATVPVGSGRETFRLQSKLMAHWVTHRLAQTTRKVVSALSRSDLITTLEAQAIFDSPQQEVAIRTAMAAGNIYLDLCNDNGDVVEVTSSGWRIIRDSPVKFIRAEGMLPLPVPVSGGSLDELRPLVNLPDDTAWTLVIAWLVGAMHPQGPYPALGVNGQQGSAKTTLCMLLRGLIDPNSAPLRSRPKNEQDAIIAAANSRILAFDNLSYIDGDLSDILCRISTGSGYSTRRLYTNDEEQLFMLSRPIVFNGIDELATRPDLLQRTLSIDLKPVAVRQSLAGVERKFKEMHPRLLGALLTAVSVALANQASVRLQNPPRMADFAVWVTAALPALGWATDAFENAMSANQQAGSTLAVDVDVVGTGIVKMMEKAECWEGRMRDLLEVARTAAGRYEGGHFHEPKGWPANPTAMGNRVRKVVEPLQACGIEVEVTGEGDSGRARGVRIVNRNFKRPFTGSAEGYVQSPLGSTL